MFMKEFNSSDLQKRFAVVLDTAEKEPIVINRQTRKGFVMLTKERYAKLVKQAEK